MIDLKTAGVCVVAATSMNCYVLPTFGCFINVGMHIRFSSDGW